MLQSGFTSPERLEHDAEFDQALRPLSFSDFQGQEKITRNLRIFIAAARKRGESLDHVLLTGPPGLGKTTLAHVIASEMGAKLKATSGPVLDKPADLAGILTSLEEGDVLFIDEIHRLNPVVEEYLYSAMEDFRIEIVIDSGPNARSVQLSVPRHTLIGATTRAGLLTAPLRARFGVASRLDYYDVNTLVRIVRRSAAILGVSIDEQGSMEIARRSRGTPRIANRLLRRCRDFAEADKQLSGFKGKINLEVAEHGLRALEVDEHGLDEMDKRILLCLAQKHDGGPVGINTLAIAVGEEPGTLEEVYEPFLLQEGFIQRTPRGRVATKRTYDHFNIPYDAKKKSALENIQGALFH